MNPASHGAGRRTPPTGAPLRSRSLIGACLHVAVVLAWCCVASAQAWANPLDAFGFGARGAALGSAATAVADDVSASYYNPAGLAANGHLELDFGYTWVQPALQLNGADLDVDASRGFAGGVSIPGTLFEHAVAFSIAMFLPDERVTRVRALPQAQPRFALYDNRPQRLVITTSGAVELVDGLYFGAGVTYVANTKGVLDMEGRVSATDAADTELLSAVDVSLDSVRYPSAGLLYAPGEHWRFGLAYRDEFALRLELGVHVDGDIYLASIPLDSGSLEVITIDTNLFSPRQLVAGVAYEAERWLLSMDFGWLQWSRFPAPTAEIVLELQLESLDYEVPTSDPPLPPRFQDIFVLRLGAERTVLETATVGLVLRGGYFFEPSPAPPQTGPTNYVDADKHGFGFGTTLRLSQLTDVFPEPIYVDLAGLFIAMHRRTYEKDSPADPTGDYVADGQVLGGTVTTRFLF